VLVVKLVTEQAETLVKVLELGLVEVLVDVLVMAKVKKLAKG
jgi:hypothetical protein